MPGAAIAPRQPRGTRVELPPGTHTLLPGAGWLEPRRSPLGCRNAWRPATLTRSVSEREVASPGVGDKGGTE